MDISQRAQLYNKAFPSYPNMIADKNWLLGNWSIGNTYSGSGYWGAYPRSYLKRIRSLFPEFSKEETLHLFSGSLSPGFKGSEDNIKSFPGITFDGNSNLNPDVCGDASKLSSYFNKEQFGIVLADCPYSEEDANKYGFCLINRQKVVKEAAKIIRPGGYLCWMDMVLPMYSKLQFKRIGEIMITRSTNHRVRAVFIFQRVGPWEEMV